MARKELGRQLTRGGLWKHLGRDNDVFAKVVFFGRKRRDGPPRTFYRCLAHLWQRDKPALSELNGRFSPGSRDAPRGLEKLSVRLGETNRARGDFLGGDDRDRSALWQQSRERLHPGRELRHETLHALDRNALADLLEHCRVFGQFGEQLSGTRPNIVGEQQLPGRGDLDLLHRLADRALVRDREVTHVVNLITEKVNAHGVVERRHEDIDDAAPHGELTAPRHHVDARVGHLHEPLEDLVERVIIAPERELQHVCHGSVWRNRLQHGPRRRHDDEGRARTVVLANAA